MGHYAKMADSSRTAWRAKCPRTGINDKHSMEQLEFKGKDMATTTKADLVEAVYERIGLSRPKSTAIVEQVFEMITQRLEQGETVKLSGFGVFSVRSKRARPGRNPKTGEPIEITSRKVVTYRASPLVLSGAEAEAEPA